MRLPWIQKPEAKGPRWQPLALLGAAAVSLAVATTAIAPSYAYFTDQSSATGGLVIGRPTTDIKEYFDHRGKQVVISNNEDSVPVFVRARVYAFEPYLDTIEGNSWRYNSEDDWYYYQKVLEPGQETSYESGDALNVKIKFRTRTEIYNPDGSVDVDEVDTTGENFNVVVVYEAVPVQYGPDGELLAPEAADWSLKGGE